MGNLIFVAKRYPELSPIDCTVARCYCGGGGDFVRGGTLKFQGLHSDLGPGRSPELCSANLGGAKRGVTDMFNTTAYCKR